MAERTQRGEPVQSKTREKPKGRLNLVVRSLARALAVVSSSVGSGGGEVDVDVGVGVGVNW